MAQSYRNEDAFVNSIIGEGTRFKGDIEMDGLLRVDGDFLGTINSSGKVLVGKNSRAECTIHAGTVVIGGIVKGDVYSAEKVIVLSSGMIIGNIYAPRLIAEEGVVIDGSCVISRKQPMPSEVESRAVLHEQVFSTFRRSREEGGNGNGNGRSHSLFASSMDERVSSRHESHVRQDSPARQEVPAFSGNGENRK